MTLADREQHTALSRSRSASWDAAIESTVIARMEQKFPGFHHMRAELIPTAARLEQRRESDRLYAEVYRAVWQNHPQWKRVQAEFDDVRSEMLQYIAEEAPLELRAAWSERVRTVTLVAPGSDPQDMNSECAMATNNAHYSSDNNTITVCAGSFVGGPKSRTLAHELAHALGPLRSTFLHRSDSQLAHALKGLREATCKREFAGCAAWEQWKKDYSTQVTALGIWIPQKPENDFLACFQQKALKPTLDGALVQQIARDTRDRLLEDTAQAGQFLMLSKEEEILHDGSHHPNPGYLNPCGQHPWYLETIYSDLGAALRLFFVNEYRCQKERSADGCGAEPEKCLRTALDLARDLALPLLEANVRVSGRYSSDTKLQRERMAEDVGEDSADAIGQRVMARLLKRAADLKRRRALYLGSVSNMCDQPSINKLYPREARAQKDYYFEAHSQNSERRQNLLITPIREALGCTKDFPDTKKECALVSTPAARP